MRALLLTLIFATLAPAQAPQAAPKQPAPPPPTLRSILLTQLRSTHTEEEWFVPINVAVADLTPEQARWIPKSEGGAKNPAPADHSVGMIANHLLFWNSEYLARMKGLKAPPIPDNKETFNDFDASTWPSTAVKLDAVLTEMEHLVAPPPTPSSQNGPPASLTSAPTTPTTSARSSTSASSRAPGTRKKALSNSPYPLQRQECRHDSRQSSAGERVANSGFSCGCGPWRAASAAPGRATPA